MKHYSIFVTNHAKYSGYCQPRRFLYKDLFLRRSQIRVTEKKTFGPEFLLAKHLKVLKFQKQSDKHTYSQFRIPLHSGLNQGGRGTSAYFGMETVENYCCGLIFDHLTVTRN